MILKSLKNKVTIFTVASILFFGLITAFVIAYYSKMNSIDYKKEEIASETMQLSDAILETLMSGKKFIEMVASRDVIISAMEEGNLNENDAFINFIEGLTVADNYKDILVYDLEGNVLMSTDDRYFGHNFGYRNYFREALQDNASTELVVNAVTKEPDVIFAHLVRSKNGEPLGVILSILSADILRNKLVGRMDGMEMHTHMLIDDNGVIVASNNQEYLYKSLGKLDSSVIENIKAEKRYGDTEITALQYDVLLDAMNKNSIKIFEFDEIDKGQELLSISYLNTFPFYVAMEYSGDDFISEASMVYYNFALIIFVACVFAAALVYYFLNRFLLPLKQLRHAAENISQNNFDYLLSIKSDDEFEDLGNAFNNMAINLKKSKEEVDRKVKAQTEDILKKQTELENQKKAALNILEDVASEKEYSQGLAEDLKKFQLAIDNASDQIIITDANGKILYANHATEVITEYSQEEIIGKTPAIFGKQMTPGYYRKLWQITKEEKKTFIGNLTNIRKGGDRYEAELKVSPILDDERNVKFLVGISRDVTKIREIDRAKTEFVSLASHQLRTPLTAIKWQTEMLLDGDLGKISKDQKECLLEVFHSNERMIDLVNSLLNVSRIDMGTFAIDPESMDLIEATNSVLNEIAVIIKAKEISVKKNFSSEVPIISADPLLLRIILQNLLSNAAKYTPKKGNIAISMAVKKNDIVISVSDSGCGIPKKSQSKIFTKLYRADNAKELDAEGSGLGLYVAKSVVEQSGGTIWFESEENKGTTFYFTIPLSGMKQKEGSKALSPSNKK